MAFLKEIEKRITKTSQGIITKTKNFADITKLNALISEEERNIDAMCLQIGKLFCECNDSKANPQVCELAERVAKSNEIIKDLRRRITQINAEQESKNNIEVTCVESSIDTPTDNTVFCSNCQSKITEDQHFCTNCGTDVKKEHFERKCPKCGQPLSQDAVFCCNCGVKIE